MEDLTQDGKNALYLMAQRKMIYGYMCLAAPLLFLILIVLRDFLTYQMKVFIFIFTSVIFIYYSLIVKWAKCPRCKKYFYGAAYNPFLSISRPAQSIKAYGGNECFYCHIKTEESLTSTYFKKEGPKNLQLNLKGKMQFYLISLAIGIPLSFVGLKGFIDHKIILTNGHGGSNEFTGMPGTLISGFLLGIGIIVLISIVWQIVLDIKAQTFKK